MEYSACLHLRLNAAALLLLHLEATTKYHQGNLHGALSPSFAFSEHIHQRLPDGPVRCRHMVTIRYLDVSGVNHLFWIRHALQCPEEAAHDRPDED